MQVHHNRLCGGRRGRLSASGRQRERTAAASAVGPTRWDRQRDRQRDRQEPAGQAAGQARASGTGSGTGKSQRTSSWPPRRRPAPEPLPALPLGVVHPVEVLCQQRRDPRLLAACPAPPAEPQISTPARAQRLRSGMLGWGSGGREGAPRLSGHLHTLKSIIASSMACGEGQTVGPRAAERAARGQRGLREGRGYRNAVPPGDVRLDIKAGVVPPKQRDDPHPCAPARPPPERQISTPARANTPRPACWSGPNRRFGGSALHRGRRPGWSGPRGKRKAP